MKANPIYSLVLCTLNNHSEIFKFIESISNYNCLLIELIVVDQNEVSISEYFSPLREKGINVKYFHVKFKGLSKSRNFGIQYAIGNIIAFPDDDCIYQPRLLIDTFDLITPDIDFISINTKDPFDDNKSLVQLPSCVCDITFKKKMCVSFTLFFSKKVIEKVGMFDEDMGVGSGTRYGSGEETDYITRAISLGFKGRFHPQLYVLHPAKENILKFDNALKRRMISYGGGYGYFIRKNFRIQGYLYSTKLCLGVFVRLIKSLTSFTKLKASVYFMLGFINGFLKR
ncbi:glycosyltransferase family 2 protein [Buttiauxella gaviniae]|uniref:glycosyltransferase family 2 protein n=1 Tax=Buttiauxella gaviniae TaxID=82990 RepID=UPI0039B0C4F0